MTIFDIPLNSVHYTFAVTGVIVLVGRAMRYCYSYGLAKGRRLERQANAKAPAPRTEAAETGSLPSMPETPKAAVRRSRRLAKPSATVTPLMTREAVSKALAAELNKGKKADPAEVERLAELSNQFVKKAKIAS